MNREQEDKIRETIAQVERNNKLLKDINKSNKREIRKAKGGLVNKILAKLGL